ncbi:Rne/Rng family ribonuclease [Mesoterricola silvestris]|uniref:Rne/Rng family ribonuclease n=1 Tax=Mesoterricola silvestris TaxID=2927979 RepID=UPI00292D44E4|nr:Rne/Rng family ribonuclease [Mesoterricola silvestris]
MATLVDGVLSDFDIEFVHNEKIKGNIYKAKVVRVDQSLQAAFIHYGGQKNGFLPIGELPKDLVSPDGRRGRIQDLLNRDQEIMVQAVREELGSKGAMMTAQISLPGRYLVLTPGNPTNGISRKIESREEREHFKRLIDELEIPRSFGVIVRTASLGVTKEDFQRDLDYLLDTYKEVQNRYKHRQGAGLVWQEDDVVTRTLRDAFTKDIEEVHIDDLETFHAAQGFFKRTMPQHLGVLKHYIGKKPLFSKFSTEEQIDRVYGRKVPLPSGGALAIDQTEALVAIDVNSGKTTGDNVEDMAFKTNMEAAEEAARQLRLRDLAGLVVIDFIDMKREGNNRAVMERLVECLEEDKARMEVGKINRFGVLVMTRQRLRPSLQHVTHEACPTCQGTGKVKSIEALVLSVVRRIKAILSRDAIAEIRVKLMPAIALAVLNQKRKDLCALEDMHDSRIVIVADPEIPFGEMAAEIERAEEEPAEKVAARPERPRDLDEETVVLGGDSPISFDKALGEETRKPGRSPRTESRREPEAAPAPAAAPTHAEIKYDRRDAQRAALEERERLRALFESAKPLDEVDGAPAAEPVEEEKAPSGRRRSRGGRKPAAAAPVEAPQAPVAEPAPEPEPVAAPEPEPVAAPEPEPAPLLLTADLLADLLTPAPRVKFQSKAEPEPEAPAKKGRPAKAKAPKAAKGEPKAEPKAEEPAVVIKADPKPAKRASKPKPAPEAEAPAAPKPRARKK